MVRLVHTADVHLHPDAPERRDALATVLDRAEAADADAVTIGGDLFEDATAAERLRPELRSLFSDRPFPVVVIPGNHDRTAFDGDAFFGPVIRPVTTEPFDQLVVAGEAARLTCVPYTWELTDDLLVALRDRDSFDGLDCLLVHCSLEAPAGDVETGEEDATRYCPVTRSELAALEFDVVLAGHYHGANRVELPAESGSAGTFVYPGTPASVTEAETGRRSIAIVDDGTATVDDAATPTADLDPLDTFHHDELALTVRPGEADDALATVRERVDTWQDHNAEASVIVDGLVDRDETAFAEALAEASAQFPHENETRHVDHVLDHPIYRSFTAALETLDVDDVAERDYDPDRLREDARERVLGVMADLDATGDLS